MSAPVVAVNLSWCLPGLVGGSEEYLCRQLLGLSAKAFSVEVYAPLGFSSAHPEIVGRHQVIELSHHSTSRLHRMWSESTWLYRRTRSAALVHHGGGTVPLIHNSPVLLTIHDLQYLEYPHYFRAARLAYLRRIMPRSARSADLIAVPSNFVKESVMSAYGISEERIVVVPHGVESSLGTHATDAATLRNKYSLGAGPIVVMPAVTHPHKGHSFVFEVMERAWVDQGITLVLTGGAGLVENEVNRHLAIAPWRDQVVKLGRVPNADRDGLIAMAEALVFPSEYEGFGAPIIEAMALGTPVITSDRACLPEIVGGAGLVLPLDVEPWMSAIAEVRSCRTELIELGRRRVREFTSEKSGDALAGAYRRFTQ